MLKMTGFDVLFAAAGNLYLLLAVIGIGVALWKGKTWGRKLIPSKPEPINIHPATYESCHRDHPPITRVRVKYWWKEWVRLQRNSTQMQMKRNRRC